MLAPLLIGLGLGLLRPLSYFWATPWSLGLALVSRFGVPAQRLLAIHPVSRDELGLIPLPRLTALLVHACRADLVTGGPWLVWVAQHPSQGGAAGTRPADPRRTEASGAVLAQHGCPGGDVTPATLHRCHAASPTHHGLRGPCSGWRTGGLADDD